MSAHATLGASSAHRWMACPGSVALTKDMPDSRSEYANEGTLAHELAELCLKHNMDALDLPTDNDWEKYPQEMREHIQDYIDYVRARVAQLGGRLMIEQRVDYSEWVPEGFGTSDAVIIAPDRLVTIDLKYGQGVKVYAEANPQARLYALGATSEFWFDLVGVQVVESVIFQPRLDHVDEFEEKLEDLMAFALEAKEAAMRALSEDAPLVPGEKQCRFCKAKAVCPARAEKNLKLALEEFSEPTPKPAALTLEQIGDLLPKLDDIAQWAKDVKDYALQQAILGSKVKGHKLVEGRSVRAWRADAAEQLAKHEKASQLFETSLVGIGKAEKVLGKTSPIFADLTNKPAGKPVLATASDKRPEIQGAVSAADDFAD